VETRDALIVRKEVGDKLHWFLKRRKGLERKSEKGESMREGGGSFGGRLNEKRPAAILVRRGGRSRRRSQENDEPKRVWMGVWKRNCKAYSRFTSSAGGFPTCLINVW